MMDNKTTSSSRIVKNTGLLYIRMFLILVVTLYMSRVVLRVLGVEDYGIYNVVGGVVTMFTFLNSSLNTATQRFLNYEMGRGDSEGMKKVFSMSFWCFCLIALVLLIVAETLGLWFVNSKLNISPERHSTAIWVYHFSVAAFMINLITVPYNAAIVAHERMSIYAYISIAEVLLKLLLVWLLSYLNFDKLWLYAVMMLGVTVIVSLSYIISCRTRFEECKITLMWDKTLLSKLFSFSGWMLAGTGTHILSTQGVNILINIFFGATLNAARGLAMQVQTAINSFASNFMMAVRPQIIKSYAQEDYNYMYKLTFSSSRLSYYLLLILSMPILLNTFPVMDLWLDEVPEYAVFFTQLVIIDLLITTSYSPIAYVCQATGKIGFYQIVISICFTLIFGLSWLLYKMGLGVEWSFYAAIIVDVFGLFARLYAICKVIEFPARDYIKKVFVPIILISVIVFLVSFVASKLIGNSTLLLLLLNVFTVVVLVSTIVWLIGLNKEEKQLISKMINKIIKR